MQSLYIYIYNYFICEFFPPKLADSLLLEFKWQQVFSGLRDSSQYSGRSQLCCSLDSLDSSSDFQYFQSPFQVFGDYSKHTTYNLYHRYSHIPQLLLVLWQCPSTYLSFRFLWFSLWRHLRRLSQLYDKFSFFCFVSYHSVWFSGQDYVICLYFRILENFMRLIF